MLRQARVDKFGINDLPTKLTLASIYKITDIAFRFAQWAIVLAALKFISSISHSVVLVYIFWILSAIYVFLILLSINIIMLAMIGSISRASLSNRLHINVVFVAEVLIATGMGAACSLFIFDQMIAVVDALTQIYTRSVNR